MSRWDTTLQGPRHMQRASLTKGKLVLQPLSNIICLKLIDDPFKLFVLLTYPVHRSSRYLDGYGLEMSE
jgi:hypothetical protein